MKIELRNSENYQFVVDMDRSKGLDTQKAHEQLEALGDAVCLAVGVIVAWAWLIGFGG